MSTVRVIYARRGSSSIRFWGSQGCFNADCTGPDTCTCRAGYQKGSGAANVCVPKCSGGCENGVCSAPELCLCKAGFKKDKNSKGKCVPL